MNKELPLNSRGIFFIMTDSFSFCSSGVVLENANMGINRIVVDAGGEYDFKDCLLYMPFKYPSEKMISDALNVVSFESICLLAESLQLINNNE